MGGGGGGREDTATEAAPEEEPGRYNNRRLQWRVQQENLLVKRYHRRNTGKLKTAGTAEKRRTQSAASRGAAEGGRQAGAGERQATEQTDIQISHASRGACSICTVAGSLYPPLKQPQLIAQSWVYMGWFQGSLGSSSLDAKAPGT